MSVRNVLAASSLAIALGAAPVVALGDEWQFEGTFYLFTAETTTGIGGTESTLSFSDALENLDAAFMAGFSARRGPLTFILDYMYTDLSFNGDTPGSAFSGARVSTSTQILSGMAFHDVHRTGTAFLALGAGFRWFDTDTTLRLSPVTSPGVTRNENDSWTDPVIGALASVDFAGNWSGTALLDWGGFVDDRETWQVLLSANYAFNENWIARIGYRYISVENDGRGPDYSFEQSGPVLGISYRF